MKKIEDWKFLIIYLLLVTLAEITAAYVEVQSGLIFHFILLCVFIVHNAFITKTKLFAHSLHWFFFKNEKKNSKMIQKLINDHKDLSSMLLALSLIPMIRILSLVMPLYNFAPMYWFVIIGVAVYLAFIVLKIQQKIKLSEVGLNYPKTKHLPLEIGIILLGIPFGIAEYNILKPDLIITSFSIFNIIIAIIIFFVAVALMEEIIFRGLLQRRAVKNVRSLEWNSFCSYHLYSTSYWKSVSIRLFTGFYYWISLWDDCS